MRGREFLMKDCYSFDINEQLAKETYIKMYDTYLSIFQDIGLQPIPVMAETGAIGGNLSHEFNILAETGENEIFFDKAFLEKDLERSYTVCNSLYAASSEIHDKNHGSVDMKNITSSRAIEVGHIFYYGDKYNKAMNFSVMNNEGQNIYPYGGCYGIGVSRLVAAIIEASHDDNGIIWPKAVSPFAASLINLKPGDRKCDELCEQIYRATNQNVLYDDTEQSVGAKLNIHDLLGFPYQIIVGPRLSAKNLIELKDRKTGQKQEASVDTILKFFA
jgi:prolyl-tRNA synthetase